MRPFRVNAGSGDGGIPPDALEPIAVVGLATRFPQEAASTECLWELLLQARSTWSPIPKERFNAEAFYHPDPEHGGTVRAESRRSVGIGVLNVVLVSRTRRSLPVRGPRLFRRVFLQHHQTGAFDARPAAAPGDGKCVPCPGECWDPHD